MKPRYYYRSAVTGRFVKPWYAKRWPHLTVRVRVKPRPVCKPCEVRAP